MRRPIILSAALATALATELAVGTLLVTPSALADEAPAPGEDPTAPTAKPPTRTGRTHDAPPPPAAPVEPAAASVPTVRSGRFGDVPPRDAAPADQPGGNLDPRSGTDSPTTDSPATDSPTTDSPKTDSPTTDQPADHQPADRQPGRPTQAPGTSSTSASDSPKLAPRPAPIPPIPAVPLAHTVVSGENLWEIAAAHLAAASGRPRNELSPLDIAPYWTRVCMANRPHLTSGDVSLVYAGEVVELPTL